MYTLSPQLPSEDYRGSAAVPTAGLLPSAAPHGLAALASSLLDQLEETTGELHIVCKDKLNSKG